MKTSPAGLAFIAREEGEVDHIYTDRSGIPTIGVGHRVRPGESFPVTITHEQAMDILAGDLGIAEDAVNVACAGFALGTLPQNAFDACVSLAFNTGGGGFQHSGVHTLINAGDMQGAAAAFLAWDKRLDPATHQLVVDNGLETRRKAESEMFLTPDADDLAPDATSLLS